MSKFYLINNSINMDDLIRVNTLLISGEDENEEMPDENIDAEGSEKPDDDEDDERVDAGNWEN